MTRQLAIKQPFNLELSLMMGQAFRWRPLSEAWFSGVIGENLIHIRQPDGVDGPVTYRIGGPEGERPATDKDDAMLLKYFREDDDIAAIYASIARDPKMATIIEEFPGLRILRQDPWECLVSQLYAAHAGGEPDAEPLETAAKHLGSKLQLAGDVHYAFPTLMQLQSDHRFAHLIWKWLFGSELAWNLTTIARQIDEGEIDWNGLCWQPYPAVKTRLMQCPGIDDTVADRVVLFALGHLETFPMDRWVWRTITEAYPEWGFPEDMKPADKEIHEASKRAQQEFGKYSGYANQYLFYWRRLHGEEPLSFAHRWHGKLRLSPGKTVDDVRYEYLSQKYLMPC